MRAAQWIKEFAVLSCVIASAIALLNYYVDPYDLWENTEYKVSHNERMKKAYQLQSIKPKSIILGSSRAEYGIDPHHLYFKQPAYNLAFSGATAYEARLYVEKAIEIGRVEKILLVVGYRFFGKGKKTEDVRISEYLSSMRFILFKALFSNDTFKKSVNILLGRTHKKSIYTVMGQYDNAVHQKYILKQGGHKKAFEKNELGYYATYDHDFIYNNSSTSSFDDFRQILGLAHRHNIELTVVIGPSHIRQWESLANYIGYKPLLQWKKELVMVNAEIARELGQQPFQVWDFAVYHELTNEFVPDDVGKSMLNYFDSSHYTERLGNIVLDVLSGKNNNDFGVEIKEDNINEHLQKLEKERMEYIDVNAYHQWFQHMSKLKSTEG